MLQPFLIDKPLGATPLQALGLLRTARPELAKAKLAYAGRLDPMASGLLPVLHGDLLQRQEDFWYLSKRYEATVLVGIKTDSYDLLGMPERSSAPLPNLEHITDAVRGLVGKTYLSVPAFSSYSFRSTMTDIPVRCMAVNQIDVLAVDSIGHSALNVLACERIPRVQGEFRQPEIMTAWHDALAKPGQWPLVLLSVHCASGTYVRSLAHELGRRLGCGAILLSLRRTRIGPWRITDPSVIHLMW